MKHKVYLLGLMAAMASHQPVVAAGDVGSPEWERQIRITRKSNPDAYSQYIPQPEGWDALLQEFKPELRPATSETDAIHYLARALHEAFYQAGYAGSLFPKLESLSTGRTIASFHRSFKTFVFESFYDHFGDALKGVDLNTINYSIPYNIHIGGYEVYAPKDTSGN